MSERRDDQWVDELEAEAAEQDTATQYRLLLADMLRDECGIVNDRQRELLVQDFCDTGVAVGLCVSLLQEAIFKAEQPYKAAQWALDNARKHAAGKAEAVPGCYTVWNPEPSQADYQQQQWDAAMRNLPRPIYDSVMKARRDREKEMNHA